MTKNSITVAKTPNLRDLLPNLKVEGGEWVSDLLSKMLVDMVMLAKEVAGGQDRKNIERTLDLHLGSGIMRPIVRKVVALITQVSEYASDGKDPAKLCEYVNGRLVYAAYKSGHDGYPLLEWVAGDLKDDLLDCKTDTVFDRRRAA